MKTSAKIVIFTGSEGHYSIAEAVKQTIKTMDPPPEVVFYKQNVVFSSGYKIIYRLFPQAFSFPFYVAKNTFIYLMIRKLFFLRYQKRIVGFLENEKPDVCIATYFMFISALEWYRDETAKPFINVIADPLSIHPIEFAATPTLNATFDIHSAAAGDECPYPLVIQPWGWFVRSEYEAPYDLLEVRQKMSMATDVLTILLAGGSEGSHKIIELIPHLFKSSRPIQIIVVCGSNVMLRQQIKLLYGTRTPSHISLVILGFTHKMHLYMQAADLVVGKAGPNMLFESVATLTPFFAITHIAGQEDGNLDIIREYGLGWVEENTKAAAVLLEGILDKPEQLATYQPALKKLAEYNRGAKSKLVEKVQEYLT